MWKSACMCVSQLRLVGNLTDDAIRTRHETASTSATWFLVGCVVHIHTGVLFSPPPHLSGWVGEKDRGTKHGTQARTSTQKRQVATRRSLCLSTSSSLEPPPAHGWEQNLLATGKKAAADCLLCTPTAAPHGNIQLPQQRRHGYDAAADLPISALCVYNAWKARK